MQLDRLRSMRQAARDQFPFQDDRPKSVSSKWDSTHFCRSWSNSVPIRPVRRKKRVTGWSSLILLADCSVCELRRCSFVVLVVDDATHVKSAGRAQHVSRQSCAALRAYREILRLDTVVRTTFSGS